MSYKQCDLACDLEEFTWGLSQPFLLEEEILNRSKLEENLKAGLREGSVANACCTSMRS